MTQKNSQKATKPRGPGRRWKKGQSGNPKGRPLKGESYAEITREVRGLTGEELAAVMEGVWAPELRKNIGHNRMGDALVVRAYLAFMREPSGSLFNSITSRADGFPSQAVELGGGDAPIHVLVEYSEDPFAEAPPDTDPGGA